jgi:ABC-type transporter Mla maintaining outer membrane lipid asymmetry ATPase subunit MlaF
MKREKKKTKNLKRNRLRPKKKKTDGVFQAAALLSNMQIKDEGDRPSGNS